MIGEDRKKSNVKHDIYIMCFVFATLFLCGMRQNAYAHKVNIFAYAEDGKIYSEAYFVDGSKCRNSSVEVFDPDTGESLLKGRTDDEGRFSFAIPGLIALRLVLDTGTGHRNDYTIPEDEIREAMGAETANTESGEYGTADIDAKDETETRDKTVFLEGIPLSELEKIVNNSLDRKLRPVTRMLINLREEIEKPGINEIVGGIGYIMGLMGVAMYFKSRRSEDRKG